jgi:hypothetical protein
LSPSTNTLNRTKPRVSSQVATRRATSFDGILDLSISLRLYFNFPFNELFSFIFCGVERKKRNV